MTKLKLITKILYYTIPVVMVICAAFTITAITIDSNTSVSYIGKSNTTMPSSIKSDLYELDQSESAMISSFANAFKNYTGDSIQNVAFILNLIYHCLSFIYSILMKKHETNLKNQNKELQINLESLTSGSRHSSVELSSESSQNSNNEPIEQN